MLSAKLGFQAEFLNHFMVSLINSLAHFRINKVQFLSILLPCFKFLEFLSDFRFMPFRVAYQANSRSH